MTLSTCSMCRNAADGVCLLGQSYIDVFQSVQAIDDETRREQITHQLACCSFWEESDLAKQISREVTLSQHAWSRIAYIKLQKVDKVMFAGLVNVARSVLHSHENEQPPDTHPAIALNAPDPVANPVQPPDTHPAIALNGADLAANPVQPPDTHPAIALNGADPVANPVQPPDTHPAIALNGADLAANSVQPPEAQPEIAEHQENPTRTLSLVERIPVVDPPLTAADSMEQAMQQLWSMAAEVQDLIPEGSESLSAESGRGSGRASDLPNDEPALNHRALPTIA